MVWPGEGVFAYDEGTVVGLVTEAEEGYSFVEWVGDVNTICLSSYSGLSLCLEAG